MEFTPQVQLPFRTTAETFSLWSDANSLQIYELAELRDRQKVVKLNKHHECRYMFVSDEINKAAMVSLDKSCLQCPKGYECEEIVGEIPTMLVTCGAEDKPCPLQNGMNQVHAFVQFPSTIA
jgi:hypothetical protein